MSLLAKIQQILKTKLEDNEGWVRQGKFTPGKNLRDFAQNFNPTSNKGNNFWSSPTASKLADIQKATQPIVQPVRQALGQGAVALGRMNQNLYAGLNPFQNRQTNLLERQQATQYYQSPQVWQDIKSGTKGTLTAYGLTNPALATVSSLVGGGLTGGVRAYQNVRQNKPAFQGTKEAFTQGAGRALANVGTTRLTSGLVGLLSGNIPALKPYTDIALTKGLPAGNEPIRQAITKWADVAGKRLFRNAIVETAVETPVWAYLNQQEKESFADAVKREAVENMAMNIAMSGFSSATDLAPIVSNAVKSSIDKVATNYMRYATSPEGLKAQAGSVQLPIKTGGEVKLQTPEVKGVDYKERGTKIIKSNPEIEQRLKKLVPDWEKYNPYGTIDDFIEEQYSVNSKAKSEVLAILQKYMPEMEKQKKGFPLVASKTDIKKVNDLMSVQDNALKNSREAVQIKKFLESPQPPSTPEVKPKIEVGPVIPKELEPLAKEARKYKSAEEFREALFPSGGAMDISNRNTQRFGRIISSSIPGEELPNIRRFAKEYDFEWKDLFRQYGETPPDLNRGKITIWRAAPKGTKVEAGDWVALTKGYAESHLGQFERNKLYKREVPVEDVVWAGTDQSEWFYIPAKLRKLFGSLYPTEQFSNFYAQATRGTKPKVEMKAPGEVIQSQLGMESKLSQQPSLSTKTQPTQVSQPTIQKSLSPRESITKLQESIKRVKQQKSLNLAKATVAKETRDIFSPDEIKEINRLKTISRSRAFQEGDIESLRKQGDTVNKVIEFVREKRRDITNEQDALDFALNFPTKQQTVNKKVVLTPEEKRIRFEALKENAEWKKEFGEVIKEIDAKGADKSLFQETGATLTPKQYSNLQAKKIRIQSEASRRAEVEADKYFRSISIPAYKRGRINLGGQLPTDELIKTTKDKMAFAYQRETILRNMEDIFGRNSKMKSFVVDNFTNNETKSSKFQTELNTKLEMTFKELGIKKKSELDYAAADYIESGISLDELKKIRPKDWRQISKAAEVGRTVYKDLLTKINEQLTRFGYEPIKELKNYVTHTKRLMEFVDRVGNLLNLNSDELPRAMAGINMETKPGRKFFQFGLHRRGGSTHEGLITSLERYIPQASRQIFHTEDIQRGRAVLDFLQKSADEGDTRLSGFTSYLSQFVDHIAGKQNIIDRPIEKVFGRKFLATGDWARRRTGANMVGGNVSSAVTNFIPFTQSLATTDKSSAVKGLYEATTNFGKLPWVIDGTESGFLARRFAKYGITGTLGENAREAAGFLFKVVDKFTSTSVVAGKYYEGLKKGFSKEQAMAYADDYAQRVMADRSFGQSPLLFNSRVLGALTQFQLEVNNQVSFLLKDIPKNFGYSKTQIASSLAQFAIYSYVFNNIYEKIVGRRPQIDIIEAVATTAEGLSQGQGLEAFNPIDSYDKSFSDQTGTGQILNQLPFVSIVGGGRIPLKSAFEKPQYYLIPPFGGGQAKKTIEGLRAYQQGKSLTPTGKTRFEIEKTPTNLIKSAVFGQWSLPGAKEYIDKITKKKPTGEGSGWLRGLFGKPEEVKVVELPTNTEDLGIVYKDVISTINGYRAKKVKAEQGLTKTNLEDLKEEFDTASALLKRIKSERPEQLFEVELGIYKSGGGQSTTDRITWAGEKLTNAKDENEFKTMVDKMLKANVLTKNVVEGLRELGFDIRQYTSGGKIKIIGGKRGKAKKITIKSSGKVKMPSIGRVTGASKLPTIKVTAVPKIRMSKKKINVAQLLGSQKPIVKPKAPKLPTIKIK